MWMVTEIGQVSALSRPFVEFPHDFGGCILWDPPTLHSYMQTYALWFCFVDFLFFFWLSLCRSNSRCVCGLVVVCARSLSSFPLLGLGSVNDRKNHIHCPILRIASPHVCIIPIIDANMQFIHANLCILVCFGLFLDLCGCSMWLIHWTLSCVWFNLRNCEHCCYLWSVARCLHWHWYMCVWHWAVTASSFQEGKYCMDPSHHVQVAFLLNCFVGLFGLCVGFCSFDCCSGWPFVWLDLGSL